jgi:hypothetical protein
MDNQQARFILQAFRPDGQDACDPMFREALEQARRDPELAAWLENERLLDAAIAAKLKSVPPPATLKTDILAGGKIVRSRGWRQRRSVLALAASIALLLSLVVFWTRPPVAPSSPDYAGYQRDMERFLDGLNRLDLKTTDLSRIKGFVAGRGGPASFTLPPALEKLEALGCRVISWHERKVTLLCFRPERGPALHLLIVNCDELPGAPHPAQPQFAQLGQWHTATWADGKHLYLLADSSGQTPLQAFF